MFTQGTNVQRASRRMYFETSINTTLNAAEVLGAFLIWFEAHPEAAGFFKKDVGEWPDANLALVRNVVKAVLFNEGIRTIQSADDVVSKEVLLRKQEIKVWLSRTVQF